MSRQQGARGNLSVGRRHALSAAVIGCIPWLKVNASEEAVVSVQGEMALKESDRASQRMQLCSAANPIGVGLQGDYFATDDCTGSPIFSQIEGPVELDPNTVWPQGPPGSVRWSGWVKPPLPGKYAFHAEHPRATLVVARQLFQGGEGSTSDKIEMAAGRYYPLLLEVRGLNASVEGVILEWTAPHGMRFLIPRALLYLPT